MRLICKGCGSTIDLHEGALDDCPICDTTHDFKKQVNTNKPSKGSVSDAAMREIDRLESLLYQN